MRNIIIQSGIVFGILYAISIMVAPSLELTNTGNSVKLHYDAFLRLMVFSVLASLYFLIKNKALKFENGAKMALILSIIIIVLIVDLLSWYFMGIYEYKGVSNFIFMYLLTLPMLGGFAFFISIFIAEIIWGKVKNH